MPGTLWHVYVGLAILNPAVRGQIRGQCFRAFQDHVGRGEWRRRETEAQGTR